MNREKKNAYNRQRYVENKEEIKKKQREYYQNHKEEKAEWSRNYHEENRNYRLQKQRRRRRETVAWFRKFKEKLECFYCDENHFACLDFHHINAGEKKEGLGRMVAQGQARATILREMSKCDVLCKNCHTKLHIGDL